MSAAVDVMPGGLGAAELAERFHMLLRYNINCFLFSQPTCKYWKKASLKALMLWLLDKD